ncbi:MAG TPA: hypothetical protein VH333_00125 [Pseudonocardiaceae bacterium]|jgi:hypothetical protein|nr:hypothetical protein [Pseudonocardiaceae bacterium]
MNDSELLARLADVLDRFDPVPAEVEMAATGAGRLAGRVASTLALVADGLPGARGGGRLLGFAGDGRRVELEIESDGSVVELTGVASGVAELRVRWPGGERVVDVDSWGRFTVAGLPAGPLSMVVRAPDAVGPWFVG